MRRLPGIRPLLRLSTSARAIERAVDDEMAFHIHMRVEDLMRNGTPRGDAERIARAEYGDIAAARDELADIDRRTARRTSWLPCGSTDIEIAYRPAWRFGRRRNHP